MRPCAGTRRSRAAPAGRAGARSPGAPRRAGPPPRRRPAARSARRPAPGRPPAGPGPPGCPSGRAGRRRRARSRRAAPAPRRAPGPSRPPHPAPAPTPAPGPASGAMLARAASPALASRVTQSTSEGATYAQVSRKTPVAANTRPQAPVFSSTSTKSVSPPDSCSRCAVPGGPTAQPPGCRPRSGASRYSSRPPMRIDLTLPTRCRTSSGSGTPHAATSGSSAPGASRTVPGARAANSSSSRQARSAARTPASRSSRIAWSFSRRAALRYVLCGNGTYTTCRYRRHTSARTLRQ